MEHIRIAACIDPRYQPARERAAGVADHARRSGWEVLLVCRDGSDAIAELRIWAGHGVIAYRADATLADYLHRRQIPLIETSLRPGSGVAVHVDEAHLARQVAAHLAAIGRREPAFCGIRGNPVSDLRHAAFCATVGTLVRRFDVRHEEAHEDLRLFGRWLAALPRPAALWAISDVVAMRAMVAATHQGLRIPEDLAVLGTGDDTLLTSMITPQLSSARVPARAIGRAAAVLLGRILAGEAPPADPLLLPSPGISVRASTSVVDTVDTIVSAAMRFIRERAGSPIGVASVARSVGVARRNLERRFLAELGRGVGEDLHQVRMQIAHDLLADSRQRIEKIAVRCGYNSAAAFSRAFRRQYGHSPSLHRRLGER
jgi:LacI family transcriptional regulator